MPGPVYQSDPRPLPDSAFEPGELRHLVPGNRGRLLDARRTPVVVRGVTAEHGMFELEVAAFEDAGARWSIPFEQVGRFQFAAGAATARPAAVATYAEAVRRLDRPLTVPADRRARAATLRDLATEREAARAWLDRRLRGVDVDVPALVRRGTGDERLYAALEARMDGRGLAGVERRFSELFVSNPHSGELIKGHAIVLAELGLAAYRGTVVRDPGLFDGDWSRARRRAHLLTRLGFVQALLVRAGFPTVTLYRGVAWDGRPGPRPPRSLVSATFSRDVAEAHFSGGPTTAAAALFRLATPVERVVMTFLETRAMNRRFKEVEAVLLASRRDLF
jgi:hypothetical protein